MSNSLWPHVLWPARLPCPSLSPGVYSDSCPLSWWCYLSYPLPPTSLFAFSFSLHQVFSSESDLLIRWPKYWRFHFSISPSNEYSGLISYRTDWFDLARSEGHIDFNPMWSDGLVLAASRVCWIVEDDSEAPSGLSRDRNVINKKKIVVWDFPGGPVVKNPPSKAGDIS